ncbi:carbon-nitrogen hydrolase [Dioszegia hungarica]|uniref:Carbon-nitrogen hydrolase n=1 Tax=Dioszegia hungarica TaxID=4972 RepID=A0AA38LXM7_9TREE|nr:carbon-nitrogen hydrolase [Dioszegia hungarica]KAI9639675.1 carbon-nitrogen hydrolase [Dioszegia hungarica]
MAKIQAQPFRLALCQLAPSTANKQENIATAQRAVKAAAASTPKPDLIVLPEIWNSPYAVPSFREYAEPIPAVGGKDEGEGETIKAMREMAREAGVWLIGGSIPEIEASTDSIYNTATVYDPHGNIVAKHRKVHLFNINIPGKQVFEESQTLTAGSSLTTFTAPFGKIGVGICYDIRFPEMAMVAARQGCIAMIYPSAFNVTTGPMHWTLLQRARAVDNQMYVSMCSPSRSPTASYQAWGHSMVVNPLGEVLCEADEHEAILYADIDPSALATVRQNIPVTNQRRFDVYPDVAK